MGDSRFEPHYERIRHAEDPVRELARMADDEIIQALAGASRDPPSPYLANVLASEALNRLHRARLVHEHIAEGVFVLDQEGTIVTANPAARRMLGYAQQEISGRPLVTLCKNVIEGKEHECEFLEALTHGRTVEDSEEVFRGSGGEYLHVAYTAAPIVGENGVGGAIVAWRDVGVASEQRRRLVESEARYRSLFENSPDLVISLDTEGRITALNPAGERITGVSASEVIGSTVLPFLSDAEQARARTALAAVLAGHEQHVEFRVDGADGRTRIYDALGVPIIVEGEVVGVHGVARDVSHFRKLESDARTSETRERLIARGIRDHAIILLEPAGAITSWSVGAESMFGWKTSEILGSTYPALFPHDETSQTRAREQVERAAADGRADVEGFVERADGRRFFASGAINAVRDPAGTLAGFVVVLRDASPRRRKQLEMRRALAIGQAFLAAQDDLTDGIARTEQGRVVFANPAFLAMLGRAHGDVVGRPLASFLAPDAIRPFEEALASEMTEPRWTRTRFVDPAGARVEVSVCARHIEPVEGIPRGSYVLVVRRTGGIA